MNILFCGDKEKGYLLSDLAQERNPEVEIFFTSQFCHLKGEFLQGFQRIILDLTFVPGKTRQEKIRQLGEKNWEEIVEQLINWQQGRNERMFFWLSDCLMERFPFLEIENGDPKIILYCFYQGKITPLFFSRSQDPVTEALKTIASGTRKAQIAA